MALQVTSYQRIELNGKIYDLVWYGDKAQISVLTKKGPRTLNGRGRANRSSETAQVLTAARELRK